MLALLVGIFSQTSFSSPFLTPEKPYTQAVNTLMELQKTYPQNAEIFDLGVSDSGEVIRGLRVGSGALQNMVVATHHGNEYGSTYVALKFAEDMAKTPIDGQTLWIIPVLNITGYNRGSRYETDSNNRSRDPNRDYPGPCGTSGPHVLKSTKLLADFVAQKNIVSSATLHTYSPAVLYPWGVSTHDVETPYEKEFIDLSRLAAQYSGYQVGNSTLLLYPADGTFEDYAFWKHGMWSLLFEMGLTHNPTQGQLENMARGNVPGLRQFFANGPSVRADHHQFEGKCEARLKVLDLRDE